MQFIKNIIYIINKYFYFIHMGTIWYIYCNFCFYEGDLKPYLIDNTFWATSKSLNDLGIIWFPILIFVIIIGLGLLPKIILFPLGLIIALIFLCRLVHIDISFYINEIVQNYVSPYIKIILNKLNEIIRDLTLKIICNKNGECPKCKSTYIGVRSEDVCIIM